MDKARQRRFERESQSRRIARAKADGKQAVAWILPIQRSPAFLPLSALIGGGKGSRWTYAYTGLAMTMMAVFQLAIILAG